MPEGEEGLYYMLHDGDNNISSNWWDKEIRELLAAWHDTFCQIKMIPDVCLSASIYQNNAFAPRLHFPPIRRISTFCEHVWCGHFSVIVRCKETQIWELRVLKRLYSLLFLLLNWSVCPFFNKKKKCMKPAGIGGVVWVQARHTDRNRK